MDEISLAYVSHFLSSQQLNAELKGSQGSNSTASPHGDERAMRMSMAVCAAALFTTALILRLFIRVIHCQPKLKYAMQVASVCLLYYSVSISLVVFNKWFLFFWEGGFRFPLLVTLVHMMTKAMVAAVLVKCTSQGDSMPHVTWKQYLHHAMPVGIATALDVGMSNRAFLFITVAFYTILKTSSLMFVLFFSILFGLQPLNCTLVFVIVVICTGIGLASAGETQFNLEGFLLCMGAALLGGFRWAKTQVLMEVLSSKLNSILTIYTISPASALTLLPFFFAIEAKPLKASKFFSNSHLGFVASGLMLGSAFFAFALIFVELALIHQTSSLTLGVSGYIKEILQIVLAMIIFHDHLSTLNIFGLCLAMSGTATYMVIKAKNEPTPRRLIKVAPEHKEPSLQQQSRGKKIAKLGLFVARQLQTKATNSKLGGGANQHVRMDHNLNKSDGNKNGHNNQQQQLDQQQHVMNVPDDDDIVIDSLVLDEDFVAITPSMAATPNNQQERKTKPINNGDMIEVELGVRGEDVDAFVGRVVGDGGQDQGVGSGGVAGPRFAPKLGVGRRKDTTLLSKSDERS
eukprot:c6410_g1_i1.p1 GENE.c6410_g1_i1~~c6410_g1_i1.p1  ORF type:complete len:573 (+),score=128.42 c6410_g1_i1:52-1770(+)